MKTILISVFGSILFLVSCKATQFSYAVKKESAKMKVVEKENVINYAALQPQQIPSFADRADNSRGVILGPLMGGAVSLATDGIKMLIAKDRKKYTANYSFALTDLVFYDQLSTESPFDPAGMQFNGFTLVRTFINKKGVLDTALYAQFALDTARPSEIINNSVFRLRVKEIDLDYTKAKITKAQKNAINLDIEIAFNTSYVNENGQLFDNINLGKFYLLLRDAPLDRNDPKYKPYYENLKNKPVDGRSFIVPRSFGYYLAANNLPERCYSQGAYSINVKVTETSKDKFITKIIMDNSNQIMDAIESKAKGALKTKSKP
ncbi:MAG: hypothetical protein H7Y31_09420 [Chitinophagaceae bacterium]|nr:hypothetical protein [Chitinophagaceae bacterium]